MPAQIRAVIDNLVNSASRVGEATNGYAITLNTARQMLANAYSQTDLRANVATLSDIQRRELLALLDKATPRAAVDATDVLARLRTLLEGGE